MVLDRHPSAAGGRRRPERTIKAARPMRTRANRTAQNQVSAVPDPVPAAGVLLAWAGAAGAAAVGEGCSLASPAGEAPALRAGKLMLLLGARLLIAPPTAPLPHPVASSMMARAAPSGTTRPPWRRMVSTPR